ncbi:MAG: hypothetical protein J5685_04390 [Clostridiales bacterium]|nr:hypothetical protein [Clostridiales bacterium]
MMRTIQSLIDEKRASNKARRAIALEENVMDVYGRFPELAEIDRKIVEARRDRLVARFEEKDVTFDFLEKEGKELSERREKFIRDNGIDPDFDQERPVCGKCLDTGFVKTAAGPKVCSCMKNELSECYELCGLGNFDTYTEKGLSMDHFGDTKGRSAQREKLLKLVMHMPPMNEKGVWIFSAPPQSGKTYLTVCIVKAAIRLGKSAAYVKADRLDELSPEDIGFIRQCEFLAIDDYSAEVTAGARRTNILNDILELRISNKAATVIVTPFAREETISGSDLRIAAKLSGAGDI